MQTKEIRGEDMLSPTIIEIGIVVTILFVGAIVEWQMIRTLGV
jgi:hypothetical protein